MNTAVIAAGGGGGDAVIIVVHSYSILSWIYLFDVNDDSLRWLTASLFLCSIFQVFVVYFDHLLLKVFSVIKQFMAKENKKKRETAEKIVNFNVFSLSLSVSRRIQFSDFYFREKRNPKHFIWMCL